MKNLVKLSAVTAALTLSLTAFAANTNNPQPAANRGTNSFDLHLSFGHHHAGGNYRDGIYYDTYGGYIAPDGWYYDTSLAPVTYVGGYYENGLYYSPYGWYYTPAGAYTCYSSYLVCD